MIIVEAIPYISFPSKRKVAEMKHHPIGPSSMYRAMNCNASVLGNIHFSETKTSTVDADIGTRRHSAFEKVINGEPFEQHEDDNGHIANCQKMLEELISKIDQCGDDIVSVEAEKPVKLSVTVGEIESIIFTGTADLVIISNHAGKCRGWVVDWKTGYNAEISENAQQHQLLAYGMAVMQEHNCSTVFCCAGYTEDGSFGNMVRCESSDLYDYKAEKLALLNACMNPSAQFAEHTGDWCKYCKVAAACGCPIAKQEAASTGLCGSELIAAECTQLITVEHADELLMKADAVMAVLDPLIGRAKEIVRNAGGSEHYRTQGGGKQKKTDWKGICVASGIDAETIAKYTTETDKAISVVRKKV